MYYAKWQNVLCSFDAICAARPDAICKIAKKKWRSDAAQNCVLLYSIKKNSDNFGKFSENFKWRQ